MGCVFSSCIPEDATGSALPEKGNIAAASVIIASPNNISYRNSEGEIVEESALFGKYVATLRLYYVFH